MCFQLHANGMRNNWLCLALLVLILAGCSKKENIGPHKTDNNPSYSFRLGSTLQSNMVVQRDKPFVVWGQAPSGKKITVNVSWNLTTFTANAGSDGNWKVSIPATAANANPQTVIIKPDGE